MKLPTNFSSLPASAPHLPHGFADRFAAAVTTLFGVGFIPKAPGTAGSAAALVLLLVPVFVPSLAQHMTAMLTVACVVCFGLGIWLVPLMESRFGDDAQCIVLDEAVGMWIVLLAPVPHTFGSVLAAFVLFRAFDILKPFPANLFNTRRGAVWVMLDDVVAGVYAALVLSVAAWLLAGRL
jgi:phosphatidylglycerophosphatase A